MSEKSESRTEKNTKSKIEKPDVTFASLDGGLHPATSHGYFHGHGCHLPIERISSYKINYQGICRWWFNLRAVHTGDIRAINMHRSYAEFCAEKYRHYKLYPFTIHPYSKLRLYLEFIFIILMIAASVIIAYDYASNDPSATPPDDDYYDAITFFADIMIMFNIIINFFTGYIQGHSRKVAVLSLSEIALHYLKTWLIVDLLASVGILAKTYYKYVTLCLVLESAKILRVPVLLVYLDNILTVTRASFYQKTVTEIFFFLIIYLCWNIYFQFAVAYIFEGSYNPANPRNCSWLTIGQLWNQTTDIRLLYAFDRAVGMLTTNTNMNLLDQKHCEENFLVICWLFSKIFLFHHVLKYILAVFGNEYARAQYYIMKKQLETYMEQRNFSPRLKKKILKFYVTRFQSKFFAVQLVSTFKITTLHAMNFFCFVAAFARVWVVAYCRCSHDFEPDYRRQQQMESSSESEKEAQMIGCMSGQLREDILMHTGRQLVRELDFLKKLPSSLLVQIATKLRLVIYIAGDIILKINTFSDCLYFIDRGTVAVYSSSGKEVCHLEDGDYFGEIELVLSQTIRTASVVAVTNCELFRLDREHFEATIAYYPTVYNSIKEVATMRSERTRVLDEQFRAELRTAEG